MPTKPAIRLPRDAQSRRIIKEALAGYKRMNKFTEAELRRELPRMTAEESLKIFAELYSAWADMRKYQPRSRGEEALEHLRIQDLVRQRQLWNRLARGRAGKK